MVTATAVPLSPAMRVGIFAGILCVSTVVLVMCLVNVCAASPNCCPFEPGAIVDSDYSSESLAYARWIDAPRTVLQRCARTFTRLFIPLRAHAFYLPSRTDLDGDENYRANPWPARIRALLFLSDGGRDFPAAHSCPDDALSPRSTSTRSSSPALPDLGGLSTCASSVDARENDRRRRRHTERHSQHHSECARCSQLSTFNAHLQLGSFGLPKMLFANSTDLSGKQLLKRLQRLERRLSRSERRALRREAWEKRQADSLGYNRSSTKDRERPSREEKKRRKREKKQRERDKRHKEKHRHVERVEFTPSGSPLAGTSTGERHAPLLEVLAPAKDVSSSSSAETVTSSPAVMQ